MANGDGVSIEAQRNSAWTCIPGRLCGGGEYVKTLADEIERLTTENGELDACATDYRHEIDRLKIEHGDMNLANVEYEKRIERLTAEVTKLKEIEAVALDVFYQHGYHEDACMCVDCRLEMILRENSDSYKKDQATVTAISTASGSLPPPLEDLPIDDSDRAWADSKQCIYGDACKKGPTCKWPHCVTADQKREEA